MINFENAVAEFCKALNEVGLASDRLSESMKRYCESLRAISEAIRFAEHP